jgi:DNA-binding Lrp family transcriptional regulator
VLATPRFGSAFRESKNVTSKNRLERARSACPGGFEVIINAELVAKDLATVEAFEERVAAMDEVAELRRMFGIPDYMIRVQVANAEIYERWLTTRLMGDPAIARVDSRITMKLIKRRP